MERKCMCVRSLYHLTWRESSLQPIERGCREFVAPQSSVSHEVKRLVEDDAVACVCHLKHGIYRTKHLLQN